MEGDSASLLKELIDKYQAEVTRLGSEILERQIRIAEINAGVKLFKKELGIKDPSAVVKPRLIGNVRLPKTGIDLSKVKSRSVTALIFKLLESQPERMFSIPDVMDETGVTDIRYARTALSHLYRIDKIEKPARGIYQAKKSPTQIQGRKHAAN